jgi:hypothetical protein
VCVLLPLLVFLQLRSFVGGASHSKLLLVQEEKRALLGRYRYDDQDLKAQADSLDAAIESRLLSIQGGR